MDTWIETASGSRISRTADIPNPENISVGDCVSICENCKLKAPNPFKKVPSIILGKFCFISSECQLEPDNGQLSIGNYVVISEKSTVILSQIGNRVFIGKNVHIGDSAIIGECCIVQDNCVIAPRMVIPPFSRVSGKPAENFLIEPISPAFRKILEEEARTRQFLG